MTSKAQFIVSSDAAAIAHFKRAGDGAARPMPPKKPKDRLAWLVKQGHISADHLELGERILRLAEAKDREPSPRMAFGGGSSGAGSSPALVRTAAGQRWDRLFTVAGPTGEAIITAIIIDGMTTEEAAKYLNIHQKAVLHMLQYTLNILERS